MEIARLLENKNQGKIYGLMGNIDIITNQKDISIITNYKFPDSVKEYLNSPKAISALKMSLLNEEVINKKISDLSESEIKAINLSKALIDNKSYLIFDYFEKGFNYEEKENYKRLFKKLTQEYNKTIILFTNDITFLWDISEEIIFVEKSNVTNIKKNDYLKILNHIDKPQITKIIDLIRKKNIKLEDYKDPKDLLKAIYRIKGD